MAGEIGHVVYAARLLTFLGNKVEHPAYWVGTLFPDIRHLGVVSRQQTHIKNVGLTSLAGPTDFITGMRVHAWIDATREKYLRENNIKESLPWHPFVPHALKWVEDEFLYDKFDDWNLIHRVLNEVHEEELEYIHSKERIQSWHTMLQQYFVQTPNDATRKELSINIGLTENSANEINSVVHMLQQDKRTMTLINGFLQHLEDLLR